MFKSSSEYDEFNIDKACQKKYLSQQLPNLKRSCNFIMSKFFSIYNINKYKKIMISTN